MKIFSYRDNNKINEINYFRLIFLNLLFKYQKNTINIGRILLDYFTHIEMFSPSEKIKPSSKQAFYLIEMGDLHSSYWYSDLRKLFGNFSKKRKYYKK